MGLKLRFKIATIVWIFYYFLTTPVTVCITKIYKVQTIRFYIDTYLKNKHIKTWYKNVNDF